MSRSRTRLVLSMIVKNEAAVIERCLASAHPHIDGYVIVDTGSTDETVAIIRRALVKKPGTVANEPWENFGKNRSSAASLARAWVKRRKWPLARTYLLLLDADMVLKFGAGFSKESLTGPHYLIPQVDPWMRYYNTRLARLSQAWRAVGVTHEYWAPTPDCGFERLDSLWIDDRGDGGSKGDKTERDIALLTKGLEDEPDNGRYMFYLAQAYMDKKEFQRAADWYEKRILVGGWEEEVWYSCYRRGMAHLHMGDPGAAEKAAGILLEAYQRRPERAEPLAALARHYREQGKNHLAYMNAKQMLDLPYPAGDTLFVDEAANRTTALEEISITAYYLDKKEEGRKACEELLGRPAASWFHDSVARSASFYVTPLAPFATRKGDFTVSEEIRKAPGKFFGLTEPSTTEYLCSTPTIVDHDGRTLVNVRLVNYYHERGRVFEPKDPDRVVRTRNVIQEWEPETAAVLSETESLAVLPEEWDHGTRVRGLEDQRWCSHGGRIWSTFTCFNIPGADGMPRVALGLVNESVTGIERALELRYEGSGKYEKNWLPWSRGDGELSVVYGYAPFTILRVDTETGACSVVSKTEPPWPTARWRGSCAPVRSPEGGDKWIGMIHETAWFGTPKDEPRDQRTVYMHRFIEITGDRLTRRSPLFTFDHAGVEYSAGLLARGDKLIVGHSVEESSSHWKELPWELVNEMLNGKLP